ncbi:hypothetical protein GB931_10170 [Modestobacter sp. I12A-02628]|uniref:Uncharacterized protein n=1 Tax=Goekera deserti TaxID=2497753 RepID=A0A7K3WDK3_9ACTN|nr:hypothetical protein [Goekera deserti]MPQ98275.1 hypothetical protein [Goekera deserti]NDI48101.1 hypothetical protein [Goekera deserti]NEL53850.1 hypothetical protein [Goekera deserti]
MALTDLLNRVTTRATSVASGAGSAVLTAVQHNRLPGIGGASVTDDPAVSARRWRAVTVCVPELPGPFPELDALGPRIEVRTTPAPRDLGTELAARFPAGGSSDEIGELRAALRRTKQLIETGEVLRVDPQPHGHRKKTPQGAALEGVAQTAPREGVL